jgi:energy-coupling factor transporter ATP-binding protein EcfA2
MKFTYLLLENYKRFSLNNIQRFEYFPEQKVQLILGTNGSGKSSLLKELTPLPPQMKNEYLNGGIKEIHIEHRGSNYKLVSKHDKTTKHSFMLDDEELNPSGTRQIQLSLVEQHFKITPELHDILTGNKTFVNLSVAERKKWFTRISSVDYTYAISVFNKLKDRHRDVLGTIKVLNSKIAQEEAKALSEDEREALVAKIKAINDLITFTLGLKNNNSGNRVLDLDIEIKNATIEVNKLLDRIETEYSIDELENNLIRLKADYDTYSKILSTELSELESLIDKENSLKQLTFNDIESVKKAINETKLRITELISKFPFTIEVTDSENFYNAFNTIYTNFTNLLSRLPVDLDNILNKENYDLNTARANELNDIISQLKVHLDNFILQEKDLLHKKDCKEIECPSCNYKWKPGYSEEKLIKVKNKIDKAVKLLSKSEKELREVEDFISRYKEKESVLNDIKTVIKEWPILKPLWSYLISFNIIKNPNIVSDELFKVNNIIDSLIEVKSLKELLSRYKEEASLLEKSNLLDIEKDKQKKKELEEKVINLTKKTTVIKNEINYLSSTLDKYKKLDSLTDKLEKLLKHRRINLKEKITQLKNDAYNDIINKCRLELVGLEERLRAADNHHSFINKTKEEIDSLVIKEKTLKILVKEMSPTEGLIAKGLLAFLYDFMDDMADIINQIWSYPLTVYPCVISEDSKVDLDYRFPVLVNETITVPDVSKTSGGMQEVINLSFKIVSMLYLGIEDYPLYLDEFGANMDPTHIVEAYKIIDILTNSTFEQIFMVSHFENCYGRFNNADVVVLSSDNLSLPSDFDYNKVVKIK